MLQDPGGVQHVDGWWKLVGELVGEFAPQGVLIRSGGVGEPKGQDGEPRGLPSIEHRQIRIRRWSVLNKGVQSRLSNGEAIGEFQADLIDRFDQIVVVDMSPLVAGKRAVGS